MSGDLLFDFSAFESVKRREVINKKNFKNFDMRERKDNRTLDN